MVENSPPNSVADLHCYKQRGIGGRRGNRHSFRWLPGNIDLPRGTDAVFSMAGIIFYLLFRHRGAP